MPRLKPRVNHLLVVVDGETRGELFKSARRWRLLTFGQDNRHTFPLGTTLDTMHEVLTRAYPDREVVLRQPDSHRLVITNKDDVLRVRVVGRVVKPEVLRARKG